MFRVLTVCTGNICRSPLAESLLRKELDPQVFTVSSAGIMAVPDGRVPEPQLRVGQQVGVEDLKLHRAQQVSTGKVAMAGLVLALSRGHRKRLAQLDPGILNRLFTLREFAGLAVHVTPEDIQEKFAPDKTPLQSAIEAVAAKRGRVVPALVPAELDVVDPFRQSKAVYKQSRDELVPAAEVTAAFLNTVAKSYPMAATPRIEAPPVSREIPKVRHFPKRADLRRAGLLR